MYSVIMVPINLAHAAKGSKTIAVAADLAKHYGAEIHFVAVTAATPTEMAHNPEEFGEKLQQFVDEQIANYHINAKAHPIVSPDPTVDLNATLNHAGKALSADLIVMGSHVPGFAEHVLGTHGSYIASHSELPVFVVK